MTDMMLGGFVIFLSAAGFLPVGGGELACVFGEHVGQSGEDVCQVFFGVDPQAAAGRRSTDPLSHFCHSSGISGKNVY